MTLLCRPTNHPFGFNPTTPAGFHWTGCTSADQASWGLDIFLFVLFFPQIKFICFKTVVKMTVYTLHTINILVLSSSAFRGKMYEGVILSKHLIREMIEQALRRVGGLFPFIRIRAFL